MASTFKAGKDNDLIVQSGQLQMASGHNAIMQLAKHYAQTLRGEMMHAMTDGVRFLDVAFNRPRLALFEADFRKRVLQLEGVVAIRNFEARVSGDELIYSATIETSEGVGILTNG